MELDTRGVGSAKEENLAVEPAYSHHILTCAVARDSLLTPRIWIAYVTYE